jgi:acyl carrier protein
MSDMEPRVRSIVAVHLDVDPGRLTPEARLGEDLCVDSLGAIELAMVLEDEFDIALPEEVLGCVRTYGDMVTLVDSRIAGRTGSACS